MRRRIAIVAVVLIVAAAVFGWQRGQRAGGGPLTLYGNVDIREVSLGFRVGGRLAEMHYEEGDRVEAGALLATLDDEPYREALRAAKEIGRASCRERGEIRG